ncbi:MAG TPA: hypothetical protein VF520_15265 [Thermoleophilaceae bacterium]
MTLVAAFCCLSALQPAASSAHNSNWCGHGYHIGVHWALYYEYGFNVWVDIAGPGRTRFHYHGISHYYRRSGSSTFQYRHGGNELCGVCKRCSIARSALQENEEDYDLGDYPATNVPPPDIPDGLDALDMSDPAYWCRRFAPGTAPNDCSAYEWCKDNLPDRCPPDRASDAGLPVRDSDPRGSVARLRAAGYDPEVVRLAPTEAGGMSSTRVATPPREGCVVSVIARDGAGLEPGRVPRALTVEVASRSVAQSLDHGC